MDDVRINTAEETVLLDIRFIFPIFLLILFISVPVVEWIILMVVALKLNGVPGYVTVLVLCTGVLILVIGIVEASFMNKADKCSITNKAIRIYRKHIFSNKKCTFRLDQINDVEIHSVLGIKRLVLHISKGNLSNKTVVLNFVRDGEDAYKSLTKLLTGQENDTNSLFKLFDR